MLIGPWLGLVNSNSFHVRITQKYNKLYILFQDIALKSISVSQCTIITSGAKNLYIIAVGGIRGRLNRLPAAASGDMVLATVKKGKPELRKKGMLVTKYCRHPWNHVGASFNSTSGPVNVVKQKHAYSLAVSCDCSRFLACRHYHLIVTMKLK